MKFVCRSMAKADNRCFRATHFFCFFHSFLREKNLRVNTTFARGNENTTMEVKASGKQ